MKEKLKVYLKGRELLRNPILNKGTAFTKKERKIFALEGLLPEHESTIEQQVKRRYENFVAKQTGIDKHTFLVDLQNRNETLFYRFLLENIDETMPYIYTPVVGEASLDYSNLYNQSRGVFLAIDQENEIEKILENTKVEDVAVIVVTDGGRILGLGDVGIGGMAIPVGKTALYTLFGGIPPQKTLPIFLDVGCDTEEIRGNPLYIGFHSERIRGNRYKKFIDRFVRAVKKVYPNAVLQWEDFSKEEAFELLMTYQKTLCSFNDDIQGTAAIALAGILSALRIKSEKMEEQSIAILGAGSAGMGIANILVDYMVLKGIPRKEAYQKVYLIDRHGLIGKGLEGVTKEQEPFAEKREAGGSSLTDVIESAKITILIGVSTKRGAFDKKVITDLGKNTAQPIVFPLSNPNSRSEVDPQDLYNWLDGSVITATGSPYDPVNFKGKRIKVEQCNNVYIFPAMGLAASTFKIPTITQEMFVVAAEALSELSTTTLFPTLSALREATKHIAKKIALFAMEQNIIPPLKEKRIEAILEEHFWFPDYKEYSS